VNADELTLRQAAAALGITRGALQKRIERRRLHSRLVPGTGGRLVRAIPRAEVARWTGAPRVRGRLVPREPQP
jgi:hypothetical protein